MNFHKDLRKHGDVFLGKSNDLHRLKFMRKSELGPKTQHELKHASSEMGKRVDLWYKEHQYNVGIINKNQEILLKSKKDLQKEKRRIQREEYAREQETVRTKLEKMRMRFLMRKVVWKFKDNVRKKKEKRKEERLSVSVFVDDSNKTQDEGHYEEQSRMHTFPMETIPEEDEFSTSEFVRGSVTDLSFQSFNTQRAYVSMGKALRGISEKHNFTFPPYTTEAIGGELNIRENLTLANLEKLNLASSKVIENENSPSTPIEVSIHVPSPDKADSNLGHCGSSLDSESTPEQSSETWIDSSEDCTLDSVQSVFDADSEELSYTDGKIHDGLASKRVKDLPRVLNHPYSGHQSGPKNERISAIWPDLNREFKSKQRLPYYQIVHSKDTNSQAKDPNRHVQSAQEERRTPRITMDAVKQRSHDNVKGQMTRHDHIVNLKDESKHMTVYGVKADTSEKTTGLANRTIPPNSPLPQNFGSSKGNLSLLMVNLKRAKASKRMKKQSVDLVSPRERLELIVIPPIPTSIIEEKSEKRRKSTETNSSLDRSRLQADRFQISSKKSKHKRDKLLKKEKLEFLEQRMKIRQFIETFETELADVRFPLTTNSGASSDSHPSAPRTFTDLGFGQYRKKDSPTEKVVTISASLTLLDCRYLRHYSMKSHDKNERTLREDGQVGRM